MLKQSELKNQTTFTKHTNGNWYDGAWDYELSFPEGNAILSIHDEVDGSTEFFANIEDFEHLKDLYELLTKEDFL